MKVFKKRDANEKDIIDALKAIGACVTQIGDFGTPDLLVGYRGRTILLEVKDPERRKSTRSKAGTGPSENARGELTPAQVKWWEEWIGGEAYVVHTVEEAVKIVKGGELPADRISVETNHGSVRIWAGITRDVRSDGQLVDVRQHFTVDPDQADTLAGALHEQAGVARAKAKEMHSAGGQ